jgi:hypothetical protein
VYVTGTEQYARRAEAMLIPKPDGTSRQLIDASEINKQLVVDINKKLELFWKTRPTLRAFDGY